MDVDDRIWFCQSPCYVPILLTGRFCHQIQLKKMSTRRRNHSITSSSCSFWLSAIYCSYYITIYTFLGQLYRGNLLGWFVCLTDPIICCCLKMYFVIIDDNKQCRSTLEDRQIEVNLNERWIILLGQYIRFVFEHRSRIIQ